MGSWGWGLFSIDTAVRRLAGLPARGDARGEWCAGAVERQAPCASTGGVLGTSSRMPAFHGDAEWCAEWDERASMPVGAWCEEWEREWVRAGQPWESIMWWDIVETILQLNKIQEME